MVCNEAPGSLVAHDGRRREHAGGCHRQGYSYAALLEHMQCAAVHHAQDSGRDGGAAHAKGVLRLIRRHNLHDVVPVAVREHVHDTVHGPDVDVAAPIQCWVGDRAGAARHAELQEALLVPERRAALPDREGVLPPDPPVVGPEGPELAGVAAVAPEELAPLLEGEAQAVQEVQGGVGRVPHEGAEGAAEVPAREDPGHAEEVELEVDPDGGLARGRHHQELAALAQPPDQRRGVGRVVEQGALPEKLAVGEPVREQLAGRAPAPGVRGRPGAEALRRVHHAVGPDGRAAGAEGGPPRLREARLPQQPPVDAQVVDAAHDVLEHQRGPVVGEDRVHVPQEVVRGVLPQEAAGRGVQAGELDAPTPDTSVGLGDHDTVVGRDVPRVGPDDVAVVPLARLPEAAEPRLLVDRGSPHVAKLGLPPLPA
mmetsp:Transcript_104636/g.296097  ORF Transcript_104636/g.296097 Transcript_104636/m.296097 type:complete len:425 (+) Transcript_104636:78-1352(+)